MWPNPQEISDLITFTEEIRHGKLPFWCGYFSEAIKYVDNSFSPMDL